MALLGRGETLSPSNFTLPLIGKLTIIAETDAERGRKLKEIIDKMKTELLSQLDEWLGFDIPEVDKRRPFHR
jgi:hypothetical protein